MQSPAVRRPRLGRLIVFPTRMAAQAPLPPEQPQQLLPAPVRATWWQRHGTTAAWIAIAVAIFSPFTIVSSNWYFRHTDSDAKSADEHTTVLIDNKLNPAIEKFNGHTDEKIAPLGDQISKLAERVARLEGPLSQRVSTISNKFDRQASLARVSDPGRVLATIRAGLQIAKMNKTTIPPSDLRDYKNAALELPSSASEYWR
jgi:hypothetical protein